MTARQIMATGVSFGSALFLMGCVYSGSPLSEPQGFSSSYFRYQMQARQQAAVVQRQRALAALEQSAEPPTEVAEEPSWWDRMRSRFQ